MLISELQLLLINTIILHSNNNHTQFSADEVELVMTKYMSRGRGMDVNYHISEQYIDGGTSFYSIIANCRNECYRSRTIPFIKPKKAEGDPNNYRTLSQVTKMCEIGELLLWNRNKIKFQSNLNQAHVGFPPGSGSTNGQLIAQEILTDAKEEG